MKEENTKKIESYEKNSLKGEFSDISLDSINKFYTF